MAAFPNLQLPADSIHTEATFNECCAALATSVQDTLFEQPSPTPPSPPTATSFENWHSSLAEAVSADIAAASDANADIRAALNLLEVKKALLKALSSYNPSPELATAAHTAVPPIEIPLDDLKAAFDEGTYPTVWPHLLREHV